MNTYKNQESLRFTYRVIQRVIDLMTIGTDVLPYCKCRMKIDSHFIIIITTQERNSVRVESNEDRHTL